MLRDKVPIRFLAKDGPISGTPPFPAREMCQRLLGGSLPERCARGFLETRPDRGWPPHDADWLAGRVAKEDLCPASAIDEKSDVLPSQSTPWALCQRWVSYYNARSGGRLHPLPPRLLATAAAAHPPFRKTRWNHSPGWPFRKTLEPLPASRLGLLVRGVQCEQARIYQGLGGAAFTSWAGWLGHRCCRPSTRWWRRSSCRTCAIPRPRPKQTCLLAARLGRRSCLPSRRWCYLS